MDQNAKGMLAAMVGWTVCSLFASVAFNWTFYYVFALAVAGRDITLSRRPVTQQLPEPARPGRVDAVAHARTRLLRAQA
jgi:hypothetical protein